MVSLAAVWEAAGVTPDAVAGHSQGEIAAASVAGVLSLEDAARVVARAQPGAGGAGGSGRDGVGGVGPSRPRAGAAGRGQPAAVIAAVNGPGQVVLSGSREALAPLAAAAEAEGVRVRWLPVDYASHSPQVDQVRPGWWRRWPGSAPVAGRVPFYSAVTGAAGGHRGAGRGVLVRERAGAGPVRRRDRGAGRRPGTRCSSRVARIRCWSAAISQTLEEAGDRRAGGDRDAAPGRRRPGPAAGLGWPRCSSGASRWTGRRVLGGRRGGWTCRRTRSSGSGTGRACGPPGGAGRRRPVTVRRRGSGRRWSGRMWPRWPAALAADEQARSSLADGSGAAGAVAVAAAAAGPVGAGRAGGTG